MSGVTRLTPRFLVKQWPEGAVVFDCHLGHTHALNATATRLFLAVCADPAQARLAQAPSIDGMDEHELRLSWQGLREAGLLDDKP